MLIVNFKRDPPRSSANKNHWFSSSRNAIAEPCIYPVAVVGADLRRLGTLLNCIILNYGVRKVCEAIHEVIRITIFRKASKSKSRLEKSEGATVGPRFMIVILLIAAIVADLEAG